MFSEVKRKKLYEEVCDQIISSISSGELPPGTRLPSEQRLADSFQVSRTAVREALRTLESSGYLEVRTTGTYICDATFDKAVAPMMSRLIKDESAVDDLLELRLLLEPAAAALASLRITEEEILKLDENVKQMEKWIRQDRSYAQLDSKFHNQLIAACHNEAIRSIYQLSLVAIDDMFESFSHLSNQAHQVCQEHLQILKALKDHDPTTAQKAMYRHLERVYICLGKEIPKIF